jgi:hypothetical protein
MGRITAFFQRVFKFTYNDKSALERLEGQATFKFRAFWSVRGDKGLNYIGCLWNKVTTSMLCAIAVNQQEMLLA